MIALSLNYGAYLTEVFRAGIQAVPKGQNEAAWAIGLSGWQTQRRVVLPQAFKIVIPAVGNDFIALIKDTSLVSVITVEELLRRSQRRRGDVQLLLDAARGGGLLLGLDDLLQLLAGQARDQHGSRQSSREGEEVAMATPEPDTAGHIDHEVGREVIVKVEGLQKWFGRNHVLKGIDLEVHKGEVVVLIGPSGSGKSTFLRCLNFLEDPTTGRHQIGGVHAKCGSHGGGFKKAVHQIRMKCGMVFQEFNLFPHKDATENVIEGPIR